MKLWFIPLLLALATPVAAQTPAVCTHQAGVEFTIPCPGFAAAPTDAGGLGLPTFTTLQPGVSTELGFDDTVSQGYGPDSHVDYYGFVKLHNPGSRVANLTVTAVIGPNCYDWYDPIVGCNGQISFIETPWTILPGDTKAIPVHEFWPAAYPQRIYFFLFVQTDKILDRCAVWYQSSECGGTQ